MVRKGRWQKVGRLLLDPFVEQEDRQ
jgi:hypothetical protein